MLYRPLGNSGLSVSVVGLGTMTWGEQNSEAEGHAQLDYALARGVNFIDTAELYAIPPRAETFGATERIIGSWLQKSGKRHEVILASKVAGPSAWCPHIRNGKAKLDRANIHAAIDGSLKRLGTDYLDLYQLHWPERRSNFFGRLGYQHQADEPATTPIEETLAAMAELVTEGKVRQIGLSNETAWGAMRFLAAADRLGLPRPVSIQNPYSLLNRSFEIGLAEVACRESLPLLAYSPLGFGVLSGKYLYGEKVAAAPRGRIDLFAGYNRYSNAAGFEATRRYVALAREHGLDPAQMALGYVHSRPFLASTLVGATSMAQLAANIASIDLVLSPEVVAGIEAIHSTTPNPCP